MFSFCSVGVTSLDFLGHLSLELHRWTFFVVFEYKKDNRSKNGSSDKFSSVCFVLLFIEQCFW